MGNCSMSKDKVDELFADAKRQQDAFEKQFEQFFVGQGLVSQKDYDKAIKKDAK